MPGWVGRLGGGGRRLCEGGRKSDSLQGFSVRSAAYSPVMETVSRRHPRGQGDQGERSAISWVLGRDLPVFLPVGHSPDYDLLTDFVEGASRAQVKTSSVFRNRRWDVTVCTRGGNQS